MKLIFLICTLFLIVVSVLSKSAGTQEDDENDLSFEMKDLEFEKKVWDELANEVVWSKPYTSVIKDKDSPIPKWFDGGEINMSYNCLDKHVLDGYGDDVAVIYECPVINATEKVSYKQLLTLVENLAGVMVNKCHVQKGDRVLLYVPVTVQGIAAILACTRIGAVYVVTFGGFAPDLIAARIKHTEPKLIITTNFGYEPERTVNYKEIVDEAINKSQFCPDYCIVYNRPNTKCATMIDSRDLDWETEIGKATPYPPVALESGDPIFIIYTSGTLGEPKGLVMTVGGFVVSNKYFMKYVLGLNRRDCWWMFGDYGWISGQTTMTFGPLLIGCSTILYEGKELSSHHFTGIGRIIDQNNVTGFSAAPTYFRFLKNKDSEKDIKPSKAQLRFVCIGGELSNTKLKEWVSNVFLCPVYDLWGQTELGIIATGPGLGFKNISSNGLSPMLSVHPKVVNSATGEQLPNETIGRMLLKIPLCPSAASSMYNDHDRFLKTYFSKYDGYYDTMDYGMIMNDGTLQILARADDVISVSAGRICGGALEEVCLMNEDLANAAFVALEDPINGQVPFAFLEKKKDRNINNEALIIESVKLVKKEIGSFTLFHQGVVVHDLPKTKTGKILRKTLYNMLNGQDWKTPATVENPKVFEEIYSILIEAGYKASLPNDNSLNM